MNEPKFTPGPLHSSSMTMTKSDWAALRCRDMQIVSRGPYVVAAVWSDGIPEKPEDESLQEKANAALIAAAPDLYAALEECAESLELALARIGCAVEGNDGGGAGHHDADSFGGINVLRRSREALAKAVPHD